MASLPGAAQVGKVVVLSGTDREATAHGRVLLEALRGLAREVVIVTSAGAGDLAGFDVGTVELDGETPWHSPLAKARKAWKLARALEAERPDVVHAIGFKPAALACLAMQLASVPAAMVHLSDPGALNEGGGVPWPYRKGALKLLASQLRKPGSFLLIGGDDELGELRGLGIDPGPRFAVLGGAGVDPEVYPVLPPGPGDMPVAAFIGPVSETSGVRELMQAFERLWARGLRLQLELHGPLDDTGALAADWAKWGLHPGVRCAAEWPADAREVWRRAEICVWPMQPRQGLPRLILEAASCGRALVIADAPGGTRSFVREDVEGLVVPAGDASALGVALERLARDAGLRRRLGAAARLRVLQGFTEAHVKETLRAAYLSLGLSFSPLAGRARENR
ncbi:MAG TPA: glycosyltransferase [Hyphomicrobiaceae bacterium]|nr:glycosyltransferase [Hyphomicrobiaceae bacterium]